MSQSFSNSVQAVRSQIIPRFKAPWGSVTFYLQLILGIIAGAGLGIWYPLWSHPVSGINWDDVATAILTYFPAIAAAGLVDFQQDDQKYWQRFGLIIAVLFVPLFLLAASISSTGCRIFVALMLSFLSIAFWCCANGENPHYQDIDPEAPTPPPSKGLKGDTAGFAV